jgi:2-amino-4-hydroxy-6-hydroxymethyldihydropteridine diphosphokinase
MKHNVFLLLGSNLGDSLNNFQITIEKIEDLIGTVTKKSSVYKTAPWGVTDQPDFLNQVISIETALNPETILDLIHLIERQLGRIRSHKWEARLIDIDILLYDQKMINTTHLIIPHPRIAVRRFVLEPLNEIASDVVHPVLQKKINQLLDDCKDTSSVIRTTL